MFLSALDSQKKRLTQIVERTIAENHIDLKGISLELVSSSQNIGFLEKLINKKENKIKKFFQQIEKRTRERTDNFYESEEFKEVGGYSLISEKNSEFEMKPLFEVEGEKARRVVQPGRGLNIVFECPFPNIIDFPVNWDSAIYLIKYHSHPHLNYPSPKDLSIGIENRLFLPKNVKYLEAIYSKFWTPNFLWLEYCKE